MADRRIARTNFFKYLLFLPKVTFNLDVVPFDFLQNITGHSLFFFVDRRTTRDHFGVLVRFFAFLPKVTLISFHFISFQKYNGELFI
jgi:hypothetical protein